MNEPTHNRESIFRALHQREDAFVIPNPWDVGSARILASMGFEALATTSAGMAFALGRQEGTVSRADTLEHCRTIVDATALPVSADLERGFGDSADSVAETILAAAQTGLAGGSIEDYSGDPGNPIYEFDLAVERIAAAVEASRSLAQDFVVTARCENFLWGRRDLDDTIKRLQAFSKAGADVLYAPGLPDMDSVRRVCAEVDKPINIVMGLSSTGFTVAELAAAGVKRISVGASFARAAYGAFVNAATEVINDGSFAYADSAIGFAEMNAFFPKDQ
jgi:2-methylisocitrate lyase-like PEP mutase family enzyme